MCFYAYIFARETKLTVRWTDIIELSKTYSLIVPDSIRVVTRDNKEVDINMLHFFIFLYIIIDMICLMVVNQLQHSFFYIAALFFHVYT